MTLFESLILGLVEGLTEFIPVSSTFHLIATARLLNLPSTDFLKLFEVIIQAGAILSIVWLYKTQLLESRTLRQHLLTSFLPTALVGAVFYKLIKGYFFENTTLQLFVFGGVGVAFLLLEWVLAKRNTAPARTLPSLTPTHAVLIGIFQALSVVPGVSRSGAVLFIMLLLGYKRDSSAQYAFMLSLPTIFAATLLDLYQNSALLGTLTIPELNSLLVGTVSAFFAALWVMRWLISYLGSRNLTLFGYYRLLAVVALSYLL